MEPQPRFMSWGGGGGGPSRIVWLNSTGAELRGDLYSGSLPSKAGG